MTNITLEEFNNNFLTQIRSIETNHTDETGVYDYGVGFNVVCKLNNRVMYFEDHLSASILPVNHTEQDVVNAAWSNQTPRIKTWAEGAMTLQPLLGSTFTPSGDDFSFSNTFDLATYNSSFTTNVARFEVYPPTDPKSWVVGFQVVKTSNPEQSQYFDTGVFVTTFANTYAENEILSMGWSNLKDSIGTWAHEKNHIPALVNTVIVPQHW
jgi:hypothetical protein